LEWVCNNGESPIGKVTAVALGEFNFGGTMNVFKPHLLILGISVFTFPLNSFAANCRTENGVAWCDIQPGTFMMGSPNTEVGRLQDETLHEVTISNSFQMQATEVSQKQWFLEMGYNPSYYSNRCTLSEYVSVNGQMMCANHPVEWVSWDEVQSFIQALNAKSNGYRYRLPTEEEWEYAARAGSSGPYSGTGNLNDMGWFRGNSSEVAHPVGTKNANAFGLYDMHGNVWEWVVGYSGYAGWGVIRGGGWLDFEVDCRSARRALGEFDNRFNYVGVRLVRTPN